MVSLVNLCLEHGVDKTYYVAYSGGLDSHVLLHLLSNLRLSFPIQVKAIHVHHGLSPYADDWVAHCAKTCADLAIDFILKKIVLEIPKGKSLEEIARVQRYEIFEKLLSTNDLLLTAHHQDDQAETVLLQLLRGAGPKGLAAMPRMRKIGHAQHLRPLLNVSRQELQQYAALHKLSWVEDESNKKKQFTRNFFRHEVMPLLATRWPTAAQILTRTAANCADADMVLSEIIRHDLMQAKTLDGHGLAIDYLKNVSSARQRLILREWIVEKKILLPSAKKLQHIQSDVLMAANDKSPVLIWANVELRRYRNTLYLKKILPKPTKFADVIGWSLDQPCVIPEIGTLTTVMVQGQGLRADLKEITVRFRQGGEQCQLPGRSFRHSLKNLFQNWAIPPWERDRVPLIYVGDKIAAIVGFSVCEGFEAGAEEKGYLIYQDNKE